MPHTVQAASEEASKFNFKIVDVTADTALKTWRELRSPHTVPIIVGSAQNLAVLKDPFDYAAGHDDPVSAVLEKAKTLKLPDSLQELRKAENKEGCESIRKLLADKNAKLPQITEYDAAGNLTQLSRDEVRQRLLAGCETPTIGGGDVWPAEPVQGATVEEFIGGLFESELANGKIVIIDTDDWTTVPAHMKWGGWNANPWPEYHVAAWRSWRDRYDANVVAMSNDTVVMSVGKKPATRSEAYLLAHEQYLYCNDIVDQGIGSVVKLAAWLMVTDAWYFWWD